MYTLYWIKNSDCEDPFKHGYIGITKQSLDERFSDHKNNHKNKHLKNRCRQSTTTIFSLFENLSREEAQKLESQYRPEENIGWNIAKGGDIPPSRKGKVSKKSLLKGENRTPEQIKGHKLQSEAMKKRWAEGKYANKKKKISMKERSFNCLICGVAKTTRSQTAKYCSTKCSAITNKDPNKRKLIAEKMKKRWKSAEYKEKVSESIRKALGAR
jgi:hypothetical protein